jgi:putative spermidine/putrescine transport system ATP-binding protein
MRHAAERGAHVRLAGVTRRFGDFDAVRDVDLDIAAGEFVTLLGPSGSGKTTTLNMVAGFIQPTAGDIEVDGRTIQALPPHKRDMGMVFQSYALFPHMTAEENVAFPLRERRRSAGDIAESVRRAFELVKLDGFEKRYPYQLSGGQQQRVALARAIVFEPRVLLMDEPLGALDRKLREWLQSEIKRLHRELGLTVIFVTHDQGEALALSDRVAVFNRGRIEQIGTPQELWTTPRTPFVAAFLGDSNLIRGVVADDGGLSSSSRTFRIAGQPGLAAGAAATLLVRPEFVQLARTRQQHTDPGANHLVGHVIDVTFLGSSYRLTVACSEIGTFLAAQTAASFEGIAEGDEVGIWWRAEHGVLLAGVDESVHHVGNRN